VRSQLLGFEGRVIYAVHHLGLVRAPLRVHDSKIRRRLRAAISRVLVLVIDGGFGFLLLLQHAILSVLRIQPADQRYIILQRDYNLPTRCEQPLSLHS